MTQWVALVFNFQYHNVNTMMLETKGKIICEDLLIL